MTERNADQLNEWIKGMTLNQLRHLWRWITLAYMTRAGGER